MQDDELKHRTKLTELEQITSNIRKNLAQEYHWEQQQRQWKWIVILGFVALIINGLSPIWTK